MRFYVFIFFLLLSSCTDCSIDIFRTGEVIVSDNGSYAAFHFHNGEEKDEGLYVYDIKGKTYEKIADGPWVEAKFWLSDSSLVIGERFNTKDQQMYSTQDKSFSEAEPTGMFGKITTDKQFVYSPLSTGSGLIYDRRTQKIETINFKGFQKPKSSSQWQWLPDNRHVMYEETEVFDEDCFSLAKCKTKVYIVDWAPESLTFSNQKLLLEGILNLTKPFLVTKVRGDEVHFLYSLRGPEESYSTYIYSLSEEQMISKTPTFISSTVDVTRTYNFNTQSIYFFLEGFDGPHVGLRRYQIGSKESEVLLSGSALPRGASESDVRCLPS